MFLKNTYNTSGSANNLQLSGNLVYIADGYSGLQILDASNLSLIGSYTTKGTTQNLQIVGTLAYIAEGSFGLEIVDISNSSAPQLKGYYDTAGYAQSVQVVGNTAYIADGGNGLTILNVTNPALPTFKASFDTTGYANDVQVVNNLAYIADGYSGLEIIDISNLAAIKLKGNYASTSANAVSVVNSTAYIADSNRLQVVDVSNPALPSFKSNYDTTAAVKDVQIVGNLAYLAVDNAGLTVLDVSNPASPNLKASLDTTGIANGLQVSGNTVYVADGASGLEMIDVSDVVATANSVISQQQFATGLLNKIIPDPGELLSTLNISGVNGTISDLNITLNIGHTWDADLNVHLISPTGKEITLFSAVGLYQDNFTNTILDDEASTSIVLGLAPFNGRYIPQQSLAAMDGISPNGQWTLRVTDTDPSIFASSSGSLKSWSLDMTTLSTVVNHLPTGSVIISDTTPTVGQILNVSNTLADVDGLGTLSYQWNTGATGSSYTVTASDVGKSLNVVASYTDGLGTAETMSSANTSAVTAITNHPPILTGTATKLADGIENTVYVLKASDLLQGYSDADNDTLKINNLGITDGKLTDNGDGSWNFTPTTDYNGIVGLSYVVTDGKGGNLSATRTFTLQHPETAGVSMTLDPKSAVNTSEGNTLGILEDRGIPGSVDYLVKLNTAPAQGATGYQVVVNFASSDIGEGAVSSSSLTFTSENWNVPQTLTLTGVDDLINDGNVAYVVTAQIDIAKTNALEYRTIMIDNLNLINNDDGFDTPLKVYGKDDITKDFVDYLKGNNGNDALYGKDGYDELKGNLGNDTLSGGYGEDVIYGGDGNDALYGENDNDALYGGNGNDILDGGIGADTLIGGVGNDTYFVDDSGDKIDDQGLKTDIDKVVITQAISYILNATLENATASSTAGNTNLIGNALKNTLVGNIGDNALNGGAANDILTGGQGKDSFIFSAPLTANVDRITDFNPVDDTIKLKNTLFSKLTQGTLNADDFKIGIAASDSNDYLLYNATTGALYYDADGNGAGNPVQIALLANHPTLTNADFFVI